ncbi:hypothetical protein AB0D49_17370 [Streptomyces sp. NPDC048290]|uniref:hypothetical protein n=1 Tax=Streptomyces sp. NPDC048290 TaxID=3155811 RepID=UPI003445FB48
MVADCAVVATTDPASLPRTGHHLTHPDLSQAVTGPHPPADLSKTVGLYGLWRWIQRSYTQIQDELG